MTRAELRYFEDYQTGSAYRYGPVAVGEAEIVEFARRYDPQPIHTDPVLASSGPFSGLIASGWQTVAVTMRLLVEHYLPPGGTLGSPGVDELRWLRPVRPGQQLWVAVTVLAARPSRSKPDRGLVRSGIEVAGADGAPVLTMTMLDLIRRRPAVPC